MPTVLKRVVAGILFLCILGILLLWAGGTCTFTGANSEKKFWDLFYSLKDEELDAVIVGSSAIYHYYSPAQAYNTQKLHSVIIASAAQPIEVIPYLVEEIEKNDNAGLIVVELRNVLRNDLYKDKDSIEEKYFRRAMSVLAMHPFSPNRIKAVFERLTGNETTPFIEYLFPVLQYHENVYSLPMKEIAFPNEVDFENFFGIDLLTESTDFSEAEKEMREEPVTENSHISEESKKLIDEIAQIVRSHGTKLLFVLTPYIYNADENAAAGELKEYLAEKNYDFLNCNDYAEEIGLDSSADYSDMHHTNAIGVQKFTSWFAGYLAEHYEFKDHSSEKTEAKWQNLGENWKRKYSEYVDIITQN